MSNPSSDHRSKGGIERAKKLSPEERRAIAATAAQARWLKEREDGGLPKATHRGELRIGNAIIPCAVLSDGRRVLTEKGITTALGSRSGASKRLKKAAVERGAPVSIFLAPGNVKPFVTSDLLEGPLRPILYRDGRRHVVGFDAEVLPTVCEIWLRARDAKALQPQQQDRAYKAEILMRALASVAIVSLVDEATGYQQERDRDELHRLLSLYLSEERLKWAKRFPDTFYQEMYRLRGWHWPPGSQKTPFVGKLTNTLVYEKLPQGVLDELTKRNPRQADTGHRKYKHHQFLSEDIGQPDLRDHLLQLVAIMRVSRTWQEFEENFERAFPGDQPRLPI